MHKKPKDEFSGTNRMPTDNRRKARVAGSIGRAEACMADPADAGGLPGNQTGPGRGDTIMRRFASRVFIAPCCLLIACAILLAACFPPNAAAELPGDPDKLRSAFTSRLTPEEKAWIEEHPEISMGIMNAWPPMNFVDDHGKPRGIGVDYIRAMSRRLGCTIKLVPGPFKESLAAVKAKTLDALMDVTPKPEREKFLNFTRKYLSIPHVIVAKSDGPYFGSERDLIDHTLALEAGFYNVKYFRKKYPSIPIKEYSDTAHALERCQGARPTPMSATGQWRPGSWNGNSYRTFRSRAYGKARFCFGHRRAQGLAPAGADTG